MTTRLSAVGWELKNTTGGSNKYYRIMVQGDTLITNYGRIGVTSRWIVRSYTSDMEAINEALKLTGQKARGGYLLNINTTHFQVDAGIVPALKAKDNAALEQIRGRMDEAKDRLRTELNPSLPPDFDDLRKALKIGAAATSTPSPATGPRPRPAPPRLGRVGPTKRPNGHIYHPRALGGQEDLAVLRAALTHGDAALLYGPPGTGKTALVEAAFPNAVQYVGHADTEVTDLVGTWISDGSGDFAWEPGPLQRSLEQDVPLFIDEIGLINPGTMSVLYPLLDGRGELHITTKSGHQRFRRGPGWVLVGAYNPDVPGAQISDALLDRFALRVEVTTDFSLARDLGAPGGIVTVAENLETKRISGEVGWAPQLRTLLQFRDNIARYGSPLAVANLVAVAPPEDRDEVIAVLKSQYPGHAGPLRLGKRTI